MKLEKRAVRSIRMSAACGPDEDTLRPGSTQTWWVLASVATQNSNLARSTRGYIRANVKTEVEGVQRLKHDYCSEPLTPQTRSITNVYS